MGKYREYKRKLGTNDCPDVIMAYRGADGKVYHTQDYRAWDGMLHRVGTPSKGVTVHPEWLLRSNFLLWWNSHVTHFDNDGRILYLDKDILIRGNKEYGPYTCSLVPVYINNLYVNYNKEIPGASLQEKASSLNPYRSVITIGKKSIHLGSYKTKIEAHEAWKQAKSEHIIGVLENKYKEELCFNEKVYDSLMKSAISLK